MQSKTDPVQAALYDMIRQSYLSQWASYAGMLRSA